MPTSACRAMSALLPRTSPTVAGCPEALRECRHANPMGVPAPPCRGPQPPAAAHGVAGRRSGPGGPGVEQLQHGGDPPVHVGAVAEAELAEHRIDVLLHG